jgi:hypothetical protein
VSFHATAENPFFGNVLRNFELRAFRSMDELITHALNGDVRSSVGQGNPHDDSSGTESSVYLALGRYAQRIFHAKSRPQA